ncbi:MAG: molybdopterin-dependent oxidoreductase [Deltaproteobacteria bacterium]|nr:molybdopterin-dependent oxidoreductase [Deltaproteobacteria bacterium]
MAMEPELPINSLLKGKIPGEGTGIEVKKTICSICNPLSHCGIDAYVKDGVVIKVEGTKENPHNAGTLCSKGASSRQYIYHQDRIRTPLLKKGDRGSGEFEPISWDDALDLIAERFIKLKEESGPESVVFFAGYSKWMRPFLKRLAHSYGSPNYTTESSLCHLATVLAARLNYGSPAGVPEISKTGCLVVWGANPFYSNTSKVREILDARERGMKIIEVGPLLTPITAHADIHLRIRPGTSGALALGMAHVIIEEGLYDKDFVENWTHGFEEYRAYVKEFSPAVTEGITGISSSLITKAARLYATTKPAAMMTGASPTVHHTNGIQNHRALTALIGLTGNYDQEGGNYLVPPSYVSVPNGVVTREAEFVQSRPWQEMPPRIGQDVYPVWCKMAPEGQAMHLPFQIRSGKPYPIRAMLAFGLNHRMWAGSDFMLESLKMLDFIVDVDLFMTDTARIADLVLPACSSFERSELKFYQEQHVIWTSPAIKPLGESRSDADIIFDLAKRIAPDDSLMGQGYEACVDWILEPAKLKVKDIKKHPGGYTLKDVKMPPYRKYKKKGFPTPSGKMEFISSVLEEAGQDPLPRFKEPVLSPRSSPEVAKEYPLILTSGARLPMFIHSRTFRLPWTKGLRPDPMVDINAKDAETRGISSGDWVSLSTKRGAIRVRAHLTEIVSPGVVNIYHGYPQADINLLIEPDYLDPISAYPGFKALLCEVKLITEGMRRM